MKLFSNLFADKGSNEIAQNLDYLILTIIFIGLISVASSSFVSYSENFDNIYSEKNTLFFIKQCFFALMGLTIYFILPKLLNTNFILNYRFLIYLIPVLGILPLVYVPHIGVEINGSHRWVSVFGLFRFQPSDLARVVVIIFLASFLANKQNEVLSGNFNVLFKTLIIIILPLVFILTEDLSTSVVLMVIAIGMLVIAGYHLWILSVIFALFSALFSVVLLVSAYRMQRFKSLLYPWLDKWGSGYQALQAQVAQERGGDFGAGFGASVQKFGNLPEAHNDFILSIMIEEWGLILVLTVFLIFYSLLIFTVLTIARKCFIQNHIFGSYLCYGIATWLFIQSFFNLAVNLGLLHPTGLNLPLISYGGSSMITTLICLSLVKLCCLESMKKGKNQSLML